MKLSWNDPGSRFYETGVNKAVLYPVDSSGSYGEGIAWNGVISVSGSPSGGDGSPIYANNVKIAERYSSENFSGDIEAFTYPDEFSQCDGSYTAISGMQINPTIKRKRFGFVYRTEIGNDIDELECGYKLHIYYGCLAVSNDKPYKTINEEPDLVHFRWNFTALPVRINGFLPSPYICIDSRKVGSISMNLLEDILYGTEWTPARLPLPDEIFSLVEEHDDSWIAGIFAIIPEEAEFPRQGGYETYIEGYYRNLDRRSF